jgi:uncharacterized protein YprB with RNaseH-like and TPR domain
MTVDLKKRLAQFDRLSARRPPRSAEENEGAARPGTALNRDVAVAAAGRELGLVTRPEAGGTLWLRDHPPLPDLPAPARLPLFEGIFTRSVPPDLQAGDLLFLDTETTGLAGGTGSLVFLVGCAWWEDQGFQVQQFFLPGPGCEPPLLAALGDLAARFRAVITFNGNVFDLPLLRTRALLARRQDPCGGLESLDLLPAARRLWGRRLANCRQQTLESEVCGRSRGSGDIDGAQIPQVYFRFLQEGDTTLLPNVLRHNRRDMEGMARVFLEITARAVSLDRHPVFGEDIDLPWQDAWANGRLCEMRGRQAAAAAWLAAALRQAGWRPGRALPEEVPANCCADALRLWKRGRDWMAVEALLQAALRRFGDLLWLHREASMLYEHRLGRLEVAWRHARALGEPGRLTRLQRKLGTPRD